MKKLLKIYTGDYSHEGYTYAQEDSLNKKVQNKFRFFKALHPINYIWKFNNSFDSFMKHYDDGYLSTQNSAHQTYTTRQHTLEQGTHMGTDNYENHIRMLESFKHNLHALKQQTITTKEHYAKQLLSMESAGFVENITHPLQQKYQLFASKIDALNSLIDEHNRKIEVQKESLQQLSQIARNH